MAVKAGGFTGDIVIAALRRCVSDMTLLALVHIAGKGHIGEVI